MEIDIKVDVSEMVDHLKKNRDKHVPEYEKAVVVYRLDLQEVLGKLAIKAGGEDYLKENYKIDLPKPINNAKEYGKYIGMLEMNESEFMTIQTHEYECIVLDEWSWNVVAKRINLSYSAKAGF